MDLRLDMGPAEVAAVAAAVTPVLTAGVTPVLAAIAMSAAAIAMVAIAIEVVGLTGVAGPIAVLLPIAVRWSAPIRR